MSQRRTRILLREAIEIPIKNNIFNQAEQEQEGSWQLNNMSFKYNEARQNDITQAATLRQDIPTEYQAASGSEVVVEIKFSDIATGSYEVNIGGVLSGPKPVAIDSQANKGTQMVYATMPSSLEFIQVNLADNFQGAISYIKATTLQWNTHELELYENEPIGLNIQRIDRSSVTARSGNYTKTITIPATKHNNKIFAHLYDVNVYNPSKVFSRNYKCQLQVDNETMIAGNLQLARCIYDETHELIEYEITINSSIGSLASIIGNKQIFGNSYPEDDLDFSEYDHALTKTNIMNSWTANTGSGYYYPIIDRTDGERGYTLRPEDFTPTVYAKEIWDKIFAKAGYTYTSNFLNSDRFLNLICFNGNALTLSNEQAEKRQCLAGWANDYVIPQAEQPYCVSPYTWNYTNTKTQKYLKPDTDDAAISADWVFYDNSDNYNPSTGIYTVPNKGNYVFSGYITAIFDEYILRDGGIVSYILLSQDTNSKIPYFKYTIDVIKNNDVIIGSQVGQVMLKQKGLTSGNRYWDQALNFNTHVHGMNFTTGQKQLQAGDEISIRVTINNLYTSLQDSATREVPWRHQINLRQIYSISSGEASRFGVNVISGYPIAEGDIVTINQALPNMSQQTFVSDIIKMFNLAVDEDVDKENHLIVEPMVDYIASGETYDWTYKEDLNQPTQIERIDILKDKNILFTYTKDDDFLNDFYQGDRVERIFGEERIFNEDAESGNYEEIAISFSPTPCDNWGTDNKVIVPNIFKREDDAKILEGFTFNDRILYRCGNTPMPAGSIPWRFISDTETSNTFRWNGTVYNYYPLAHHTDNPYNSTFDLNFGKCDFYYHGFSSGSSVLEASGSNANITNNNLYSLYWEPYITQLADSNSKKVTKWFKLDLEDIRNFRFSNTYFVDNVAYSVNKISDYDPHTKLVEVELYKLASYNTKNKNTSTNKIKKADVWTRPVDIGSWTDKQSVWNKTFSAPQTYRAYSGSLEEWDKNTFSGDVNNISSTTRGFIAGANIYTAGYNSGVFLLGRDFRVEGDTVDVMVMNASGSVVGTGTRGGIIINSTNATLRPGSTNVAIIGGNNVTNTDNNQTILGGNIISQKDIVLRPDVVDGQEDKNLELFPVININLVDGGEDTLRNLGSYSVINWLDGGEIE